MMLLSGATTFLCFIILPCWAVILTAEEVGEPTVGTTSNKCFQQQYANTVADFGALHLVRRVAVVSTFFVYLFNIYLIDF
jgi:hypothetical protein